MTLVDVEGVGRATPTCFDTLICRDCAVAMVLRTEAALISAT